MKIGILSYRQVPYISANTAIAYIIGEQLSRTNEVLYIGRRQDKRQKNVNNYNNSRILFLNPRPKKEISWLRHRLIRLGLMRLAFFYDVFELKRIIVRESIDALICVIAPAEDAYIAMSLHLKIPVYLYQLDPFYNHNDVEDRRLKKIFIKYLVKVKHVFTTDLLFQQYRMDSELKPFMKKISVVQFPKLVRPKVCMNKKIERTLLLYSGSLYADRKPEYLIELRECLPPDCDIVFCGKCETQRDLEMLLDNKILYKGYCSQEELSEIMSEADIFINIGNKVRNQLPSKVIDYIATGKPIINISQIEKCSSRDMLRSYDYYLDIDAQTILQNREKIYDFIIQFRNKSIPWEEIKARYKEYLPEYVAGTILKIIEMDYHDN